MTLLMDYITIGSVAIYNKPFGLHDRYFQCIRYQYQPITMEHTEVACGRAVTILLHSGIGEH